MWVSTSRRTPASSATRAASAAVEWPVSWARASSSLPNVASCTRRSAPRAASVSERHGRVSPEYTTVRPARGSPTRSAGRYRAPVLQHDRLALVQPAPQRALRYAELARPLGMKPAQPRVLHQRVADRVGPVLGLEHDDVVLVAGQPVARLQLHDLDRELVPLDAERRWPRRGPAARPAVRRASPPRSGPAAPSSGAGR